MIVFKKNRFNNKHFYNQHRRSRGNGSSFTFHLSRYNSTSNVLIATMVEGSEDALLNGRQPSVEDPQGAMLYVVMVIFLWGFSIVLLIASYIRKNHTDRSVSLYLEQIKTVRRKSRRDSLFHTIASNLGPAQVESLGLAYPSSHDLAEAASSPPPPPLFSSSGIPMRPRARSVPTPQLRILARQLSGRQQLQQRRAGDFNEAADMSRQQQLLMMHASQQQLMHASRPTPLQRYAVIPEHQSARDLLSHQGGRLLKPSVSPAGSAYSGEGEGGRPSSTIWSADSFSADDSGEEDT